MQGSMRVWIAAAVCVVGVACSSGSDPVAVTGVTLTPTTVSLAVGATQQLTATVAPANATNAAVSWSSSLENVASVSASGLVSAGAPGDTTITVTTADGAFKATCAVTVTGTEVVRVTGVTVSPTTATLAVGATQQLTATVAPANATNPLVGWASSAEGIATVSSQGLVTAIAQGSATITANTADGSFKATSAITVTGSGGTVSGSILYTTTGDNEIHAVAVDGTNDRTLTALGYANAAVKYAVWSPDGTKVLVVMKAMTGDTKARLYIVSASETSQNPAPIDLGNLEIDTNPLTGGTTACQKRYAVWMSTDSIVLIARPSTDTSSSAYGFYKLAISLNTVVPIKAAMGACNDFELAPDGNHLLVQAPAKVSIGGTQFDVLHIHKVYMPDGTTTDLNADETTAANYWLPQWLGGSRLAYVKQTNVGYALGTMNLDGTGKQELVTTSATNDVIAPMTVARDGSKIAYRRSNTLHAIGADGTGGAQLSSAIPLGFDWSGADANTIAYYAIKGTESNVFFVRTDKTEVGKVWAQGKAMNQLGGYRSWYP